jgi:two-component system response regulator LytT
MRHSSKSNNPIAGQYPFTPSVAGETMTDFKEKEDFKNFFQQYALSNVDDLLTKLIAPQGKKSFLVFQNNKYFNVLTENIAYFYIKYDSPVIVTFDKQEYFVNHSLEQIQNLVAEK